MKKEGMDALSYCTEEVLKADREALRKDKETAKEILAGGIDGLRKFCELIKADIAGFEEQVWKGRESALSTELDELIAMREYGRRILARGEFYINLANTPETAPAKAGNSEKS